MSLIKIVEYSLIGLYTPTMMLSIYNIVNNIDYKKAQNNMIYGINQTGLYINDIKNTIIQKIASCKCGVCENYRKAGIEPEKQFNTKDHYID